MEASLYKGVSLLIPASLLTPSGLLFSHRGLSSHRVFSLHRGLSLHRGFSFHRASLHTGSFLCIGASLLTSSGASLHTGTSLYIKVSLRKVASQNIHVYSVSILAQKKDCQKAILAYFWQPCLVCLAMAGLLCLVRLHRRRFKFGKLFYWGCSPGILDGLPRDPGPGSWHTWTCPQRPLLLVSSGPSATLLPWPGN